MNSLSNSAWITSIGLLDQKYDHFTQALHVEIAEQYGTIDNFSPLTAAFPAAIEYQPSIDGTLPATDGRSYCQDFNMDFKTMM